MLDYRLLKAVEFGLHRYNDRAIASWHVTCYDLKKTMIDNWKGKILKKYKYSLDIYNNSHSPPGLYKNSNASVLAKNS